MATRHPIVEVVDASGQPITGDAGNLTLKVITDGVGASYTGSITEVEPGQYAVAVTEAGVLQSVSGTSSTSGGIVVKACWTNVSDALANVGFPVTWYVSPRNGNDTTGDGSRAKPWARAQTAVDSVVDGRGDIVQFLDAGAGDYIYRDLLVTRKTCFTIIGHPNIIWTGNGQTGGCFDLLNTEDSRYDPPRELGAPLTRYSITLRDIRFVDETGTYTNSVWTDYTTDKHVVGCSFENFPGQPLDIAANSTVEGCTFIECGRDVSEGTIFVCGVGANEGNAANVVIRNNTFIRCGAGGVFIAGGDGSGYFPPAEGVTVTGNTFMDTCANQWNPVAFDIGLGIEAPHTVSHCTVVGNSCPAGVRDDGSDNEVYNNEAPTSGGAGTGAAAVTLYVKDGSATPIAGASVTVGTAGTLTTAAGTGAATWNLDDGTYTVLIRSSSYYTPAASYTVVVAGGAVTSPAGGVLTVTAIALPTPASADNFLIWGYEEDLDGAVGAGENEVVVEVVDCSDSALYTAADGTVRRLKGTRFPTNANGIWSFNIAKAAVAAGGQLTILRTWTICGGGSVKSWAKMDASKANASDQIAWAAWGPVETT
jgi:hypothetical protein